ncbi:hypothetical protein J6590_103247, partial [Homalodisca vitripennis]
EVSPCRRLHLTFPPRQHSTGLSGRNTEVELEKNLACGLSEACYAKSGVHSYLVTLVIHESLYTRTQMFEARVCRRITANKSSIVRLWPKNVLPVVVNVIMSAKLSRRTRIIVND